MVPLPSAALSFFYMNSFETNDFVNNRISMITYESRRNTDWSVKILFQSDDLNTSKNEFQMLLKFDLESLNFIIFLFYNDIHITDNTYLSIDTIMSTWMKHTFCNFLLLFAALGSTKNEIGP